MAYKDPSKFKQYLKEYRKRDYVKQKQRGDIKEVNLIRSRITRLENKLLEIVK